MRRAIVIIGVLVLEGGCGDDGGNTTGQGSESSGGADDVPVDTIPPLTMPPGDDGGDGSSSGAPATDDTTGDSTPDDSGTAGSGSSGDASSSGGASESSTGDVAPVVVEWCRLQAPESVTIAPGASFTAYGRLYVDGVTDQTVGVDPYPALIAELGFGADGSDPAVDPWTWTAADPNPGWDGTDWGEPNNDEYMGEITIDRAGTYDYAARFSGDSGRTWVYCDLDDLLTGGYTPDQAGDATVE